MIRMYIRNIYAEEWRRRWLDFEKWTALYRDDKVAH